MPERTDAYAYFWAQGFPDAPDEISVRLQLKPTSTECAGDIRRHGPAAKFNRWVMLSPLARGDGFLQDYLESLLSLLELNPSAVRDLASKYEAGIACVGYYYGRNPGLHLSATLLARLAALRIPVDFDLYNYSEEDAA